MNESPIREQYANRAAGFAAHRDAEAKTSFRLSHARAAAFLALVAAGLWAELRPGLLPATGIVLSLGAFIVLLFVHGRVRRRQRRFEVLVRLSEHGLHRLSRRWAELPARPAPPQAGSKEGVNELDLFGKPALLQLMGPTATPQGQESLASMLISDDEIAEIVERQVAVDDLAGRVDFRDHLAADGILEEVPGHAAIRRFLDWAESEPHGLRIPTWVTVAVPVLWGIAFTAWGSGVAPASIVGIPLLISMVLTFGSPGRDARAELSRAFGSESAFRAYPALFDRASSEPFEAPLLIRISEELRSGPHGPTRQMKTFARLAHLAGLRSGMLYIPVQLLTLWDSHVLRSVDAWRSHVGPHVGGWFDALGRVEALSAIATLAHDNPDWPFPGFTDDPSIVARGLGHPMIDPARRVDNDVTVGPPGSFLLITGSNMSGKSTLLRAIGLNVRLAMAGAPVCAKSMTQPRAELRTSFHVEDSLADGVSLFMAQLQRVKAIVDAARDAASRGRVMVYLMDEMLAGTNTAERRIAAARVIRHLVEFGAIGAVTTHDLALASVEELRVATVPVHFRETVHPGQEPALTFDYRLRDGVATSTNALRLMEIVGLGEDRFRGPDQP